MSRCAPCGLRRRARASCGEGGRPHFAGPTPACAHRNARECHRLAYSWGQHPLPASASRKHPRRGEPTAFRTHAHLRECRRWSSARLLLWHMRHGRFRLAAQRVRKTPIKSPANATGGCPHEDQAPGARAARSDAKRPTNFTEHAKEKQGCGGGNFAGGCVPDQGVLEWPWNTNRRN